MWKFLRSAVVVSSAVICSEVGDNTFFVAVILSMSAPRSSVFAGALCANIITHILSVMLSRVPTLVPEIPMLWISITCLSLFGVKMIFDAFHMSPNKTEREYREAEEDIQKHKKSISPSRKSLADLAVVFLSASFVEAFVLTFVGEWGDRSQISTVLMASQSDLMAVLLGGFVGYAISLALATLGGRYIATKISVRAMTLLGGIVFLLFAAATVLDF